MLPSRSELTDNIVRLVEIRSLDPLEILLDGHEDVRAMRGVVTARAGIWAHRMLNGTDADAVGAIMRLVTALYPSDGAFDPPVDWWRTPLGRVLAWRVGHPTAEYVSYSVAGAMLGITRQGVYDLVTRGKLVRHPAGGVTRASVRERLITTHRTRSTLGSTSEAYDHGRRDDA
jgi:hypothetical protein